MRLLVDAHIFDGKYQGTRTYLKGLYTELIKLAKDWHFFIVAQNIDNLKSEFGEHINVTYLSLKHSNKFYRLLIEIPRLVKTHKIDYAHFQYVSPLFKNCKHIVTIHDILFEQKEFKSFFPFKYRLINGILFKISAKRADILLTVSQYSKEKISKLYQIDNNKIIVTPNAVSNNYTEGLITISNDINSLGKYILYVSRVEPRKNHLTLIKAFVELGLYTDNYKLVLIGKVDIMGKQLKTYYKSMPDKIKNRIIWMDNVSYDDLRAYYKNCELFVFPSFAEGFGIPPLEAMSFNKKLLCSNVTAMVDFNLPDEMTFDPTNIEELKQKMHIQLSTEFNSKQLYTVILDRFNWTSIAKGFYETINKEVRCN